MIALAYIDIATYQTTRTVLENIVEHVAIGGKIVIDDFGPQYAGVSKAIKELGLRNFKCELSKTYSGKLIYTRES